MSASGEIVMIGDRTFALSDKFPLEQRRFVTSEMMEASADVCAQYMGCGKSGGCGKSTCHTLRCSLFEACVSASTGAEIRKRSGTPSDGAR